MHDIVLDAWAPWTVKFQFTVLAGTEAPCIVNIFSGPAGNIIQTIYYFIFNETCI
jgi:hypothetical protein